MTSSLRLDILPPAQRQETPDGVLEIASLQDLLAHKLKVLLQCVETKDYLDIDALLNSGLDLVCGLAGARALFPAFAPQECLKALTYFNDPPLETLSIELQERLLSAGGRPQWRARTARR
jgi:hypothetical protein